MNKRLRIRYASGPGTPSGRRGSCRPPHHWLMPCATTSCTIDLTAAARKVPAMITGELKSNVDRIWATMWAGGISNPLSVMLGAC